MMTRFLFNSCPFPFCSPDDGAGQGADPAGQAPAAPAAEPVAPQTQEAPKTLDDVLADKAKLTIKWNALSEALWQGDMVPVRNQCGSSKRCSLVTLINRECG